MEMAYISDAERDSAQQILTTYANTIHTGDQLYIYVSSEMIESVVPFNQETHIEAVEMSRMNTVSVARDGGSIQNTYTLKKTKYVYIKIIK